MTVRVEQDGHVVVITLDRPEARNALDPATDEQLREAFTAFKEDRTQWVAVLCGAGDHFCAGADLKARQGSRPTVPEGGITRDYWTTKPIIAALQGAVYGGGLELALCADLRVADETAMLLTMPLDDGIRMETLIANLLAGTADMQEGRRAFVEKRAPRFDGR